MLIYAELYAPGVAEAVALSDTVQVDSAVMTGDISDDERYKSDDGRYK
jgi:hypothetical protein